MRIPVRYRSLTLDIMGGKWKGVILFHLMNDGVILRTDFWKSLSPIIMLMRDWGNEYLRQITPGE